MKSSCYKLPCQFLVVGIGPDKSGDDLSVPVLPGTLAQNQMRVSYQCSAKMKIRDFILNLLNIADGQIIPLGYMCRMVGYNPILFSTTYRGVAFLPLNKEKGGGAEFIGLIGYTHHMWVLRSTEMSWMRLDTTSSADCWDIVTFRGKFYAVFTNGDVFEIDPYTLETTPLRPTEIVECRTVNYLVPYGDDELYLC